MRRRRLGLRLRLIGRRSDQVSRANASGFIGNFGARLAADFPEVNAGSTWREAGGGLPPGFAIAIDDDNPDVMLFAGRNRLYLSENGGTFWR